MNELTPSTKKLMNDYAIWQRSLKQKEGVPVIHVDEVALKVAAFYEQIRTIIDWKEEHLMRRTAIIRKLKRRFLDLELNNFTTAGMAEPLVLEFIRGGYFPNDRLPESKIAEVQHIIDKYVFILKHNPENKKGKTGLQFYTLLLEIAACEIEETLAPSTKEMALIEFMFSQMQERIKVSEDIYEKGLLSREETNIQIYIAVQQALFKLDEPIISYNLIKYKYPQWQNPTEEELLKLSQNMYKILAGITKEFNHPLGKKFYAICEKYDTPYLLLGDILTKETPEKVAEGIYDPISLESMLRGAYNNRLADLKQKITRAAIYSTASIFITKILALLILEWALAWLLHEELNVIFLALDVIIPTALMGVLVATIRPPSKRNFSLVTLETMKVVYQKDQQDTYDIKLPRKRSLAMRIILSLVYLLGACVSFGLIFWGFEALGFPIPSIIINILFIALILFAGGAVRTRSRELSVEDAPNGFLSFVSDVLFLPLAGVGRWMSNTWKQYNAITAFLNALIDMPFSMFVEFLERWRYFIKDRKEEIR